MENLKKIIDSIKKLTLKEKSQKEGFIIKKNQD